MNEEERQAVEVLKSVKDGFLFKNEMTIVLNLIEKQNKKLKEIEAIVDTTPYVAYTSYGDILYESDEILEIIRK